MRSISLDSLVEMQRESKRHEIEFRLLMSTLKDELKELKSFEFKSFQSLVSLAKDNPQKALLNISHLMGINIEVSKLSEERLKEFQEAIALYAIQLRGYTSKMDVR